MPPRVSVDWLPMHGGDVESALDGQIEDGAAGERADPHGLAAHEACALEGSQAAGRRSPSAGTMSIARLRAGGGNANAVGLHRQRRSLVGDLERAHVRRDCRRAGWRRAGSRGRARPTPARPGAGSPAGPGPAAWSCRPGATTRSAAVMRVAPSRHVRLQRSSPAAALASRRLVLARARSAANVTLSPAASSAGGSRRMSHSGDRRAREDVPPAGALQRIDDRHGHGDGDGAARHLDARVLPPRQLELLAAGRRDRAGPAGSPSCRRVARGGCAAR